VVDADSSSCRVRKPDLTEASVGLEGFSSDILPVEGDLVMVCRSAANREVFVATPVLLVESSSFASKTRDVAVQRADGTRRLAGQVGSR
jgi:hypothetical protein